MLKVLEDEKANLEAPRPKGLATSNRQSSNATKVVLDREDSILLNNFNIESGDPDCIE